MSDVSRPEDSNSLPSPNGAFALELRIADLLDGVTVPGASNTRAGESKAPQESVKESSALPGEPLVKSHARPAYDAVDSLPPFLAQGSPARETEPSGARAPGSAWPAPAATSASPDMETSEAKDASPAPTGAQIVYIRGRSDGVAIEIGVGAWTQVMAALSERLESAAGFFRKSSVALDLGARPVTEGELQELAQMLAAQEMTVGVVRTRSERTFQAALAVGLAVMLEAPEGVQNATAMPATFNSQEREADAEGYFVYRGYLRSGHRLHRREHVLVIGDVNPGAEVLSDGDVLVWGRLRGVVHAGAGGNRRALVAALDLEPTQLRIANVIKIAPDPKPGQPGRFFWRRAQHKRPEIARIVQDEIVIEEWDMARPGGLVALQRGDG